MAVAGLLEQAAVVVRQAETIASSITDPDRQAETLVQVAETLAKAGDNRSACRWPQPFAP
jgi:hypothetical protein